MQLDMEVLKNVIYLTGDSATVDQLSHTASRTPFSDEVIDFLNCVSRFLMKDNRAKKYSDVITFAFWVRRSSVLKLKERFLDKKGIRLGKGIAFHIAPSNVPVNFAYSLASGLLTGNSNIVRVPTKEFPQVSIITEALNTVLENFTNLKPYIICVRYDRDKRINDLFSSMSDIRIIWGGDNTIKSIRESPIPPRSIDITFADRYSLAIIDSDFYLENNNKKRIAEDFYNDTYFSDQNACTSPKIIVWLGEKIDEAKEEFWEEEYRLVKENYMFQSIQGVNKFVRACLVSVAEDGVKVEEHVDNMLIRVKVSELKNNLMDYQDNSGFFYEYDCKDIMELMPICDEKKCQTIAYIGEKTVVMPLIEKGVKGIDRIVPVGKTMDFDLIWDGYELPSVMTRTVVMK